MNPAAMVTTGGLQFGSTLAVSGVGLSTSGNCMGGIARFVQWLGQRRIRVRRIDESVVAEFLNEHLARWRIGNSNTLFFAHDRPGT